MNETENDKTEQLIELIQQYEFLFDLSHKDYKNTLKKDQAWKELAEMLNMTVEDCTRVWRNLRDRFTREKRRLPTGSQAPEVTWVHFDKMLFYNKFTRPRKTHTATPSKPDDSRLSSSCSSSASAWSSLDTIISPRTWPDWGDDNSVSPEGCQDTPILYDHNTPALHETDTPVLHDHNTPVLHDHNTPVLHDNDTPVLHETTPRSHRDSKDADRAGKRKRKNEEIQEVLTVAKTIASTIQRKEVTKKDSKKSLSEYICARLDEMTPEVAKKKRRALLLILEEDDNN